MKRQKWDGGIVNALAEQEKITLKHLSKETHQLEVNQLLLQSLGGLRRCWMLDMVEGGAGERCSGGVCVRGSSYPGSSKPGA